MRAVAYFDVDTAVITDDDLSGWIVGQFGARDNVARIGEADQKDWVEKEIARFRNIATLRIDQTTGGDVGLVVFERPDPGKLEVYVSHRVWNRLQTELEGIVDRLRKKGGLAFRSCDIQDEAESSIGEMRPRTFWSVLFRDQRLVAALTSFLAALLLLLATTLLTVLGLVNTFGIPVQQLTTPILGSVVGFAILILGSLIYAAVQYKTQARFEYVVTG